MEAALSLIEHFNMQQMASNPTDKGSLDMILDSRRLSQFLSVMRMARVLDEQDIAKMRLDAQGDPLPLDEAFSKWLTSQPKSSQQMGDTLLKAIDSTFPSKNHYELEHHSA